MACVHETIIFAWPTVYYNAYNDTPNINRQINLFFILCFGVWLKTHKSRVEDTDQNTR